MKTVARLTPDMEFSEAFAVWIAGRTLKHGFLVTDARYISKRTEWDYRQYARALERFFVGVPLQSITFGNLYAYHVARAYNEDQHWTRQAGANRIRKEIGMLIRMLRSAGVWTEEMGEKFERLAVVESDVQRAMSPDEQQRFLNTAVSRDDWALIHQYAIVALQTTMSTNELRGLLIGDVRLQQGIVQVRVKTSKNKYRIRSIPLESREVVWAFESLIWRARELGAGGPHHYLFPFRVSPTEFDPTRPMTSSGLKKRWAQVRVAAGLPWLRPYDLRHTAITRLAEAGVSISVMMSMAGHMSVKMQQHYTQVSMMAKRKAVASTWKDGMPQAYRRPVSFRELQLQNN